MFFNLVMIGVVAKVNKKVIKNLGGCQWEAAAIAGYLDGVVIFAL
jgi:hypothetical protein